MSLINLNMLTMPAQAAFVQLSLPIGSLTAYLGEDVPADWLVCDGSSTSACTLSRSVVLS